ncbi:uncharacterized protein [Ptychodera flava]|uniref:uncharacterized protein n=1 Tax=Ptychodera flava TaxID=63121 RepID=UPI00396A8CBB
MSVFRFSPFNLLISVLSWIEVTVCGVKECQWMDNHHTVEYTCPDDKYCCGAQECCEYSVSVDQDIVDLWYFWLCVGLAILVLCAVSGFACGKRYRKRKKKKKKKKKKHHVHVIHTTTHLPEPYDESSPEPPPHYASTRPNGLMTTGHDPYGPSGSSIEMVPVGDPASYGDPGAPYGASGAMALSPAYGGGSNHNIPAPPGFYQSKEVPHL